MVRTLIRVPAMIGSPCALCSMWACETLATLLTLRDRK
jgi:hypothetical protein